jgi:hypothetical protein
MTVAAPGSAGEALGMLASALGYLASADATQMGAEVQARCLKSLEQATAVGTVARASILGAFTAGKGYCDDAMYSPRAWLIRHTKVTKGTAAGHIGWVRRARAHPRIARAMAAGELTESWARAICGWPGQLPEDSQDTADDILAGAVKVGSRRLSTREHLMAPERRAVPIFCFTGDMDRLAPKGAGWSG